mgnify:CR=1 FL=1
MCGSIGAVHFSCAASIEAAHFFVLITNCCRGDLAMKSKCTCISSDVFKNSVRVCFWAFALTCIILFTPVLPSSKAYASYADYNPDGTITCTKYAWQYAQSRGYHFSDSWGNAGNWYGNASDEGYVTDGNPTIDSIACWSVQDNMDYGHVAYVVDVGDDYIDITEGGSRWPGASEEGICNRRI